MLQRPAHRLAEVGVNMGFDGRVAVFGGVKLEFGVFATAFARNSLEHVDSRGRGAVGGTEYESAVLIIGISIMNIIPHLSNQLYTFGPVLSLDLGEVAEFLGGTEL